MKQKGFAAIPIMLLLLVFLIGGYLLFIRFSSTPVQTNSQLAINGRNKYTNSKYGFEFEYDKNSSIYNETESDGKPVLLVLYLKSPLLIEPGENPIGQYLSLEIDKGIKCPVALSDLKNATAKKISVGSRGVDLIEGGAAYNNYRRSICLFSGGNTFWFVGDYSDSSPEAIKKTATDLFNAIIASFKFSGQNDQAKTYNAENLNTDLKSASYWPVPQTDLEIKTPSSFTSVDQSKRFSFIVDPVRLLYVQMPGSEYPDPIYDFKVGSIVTSLSPQEWVLNNVSYQGTKLKDQPAEVSRGKTIFINGRDFLSLSIGCCGGYERAYFYKTADKNNSPILLVFMTNAISFENRELERNSLLDIIIGTLQIAK